MNLNSLLNVAIVVVAIAGTAGLLRLSRWMWKVDENDRAQVRVFGAYSPLLTWFRYRRLPSATRQAIPWAYVRARAAPYVEVGVIVLLAAWFGRSYLDLNPSVWPVGREFAFGIQSHYIWTLLARCGACVMWNGFSSGGSPAFVELHGAPLHPLIFATTILWGAVNGAKLSVVACLALAGGAQWWLARIMQLGAPARLWAGAIAIVAGHVAGRMQVGLVPLALSMAACALLLAACVDLALNRTRQAAVRLGIVLALALLAGQGYMQIGMAFSVLPALILLLLDRNWSLRPVWKEFALAGGLAVLLAGVWIVPLLHFWPNIDKATDPNFGSAQPLAYLPLNLVIGDSDFYSNASLDKQPFAYLYANYVGWVPVLLALLAVHLASRSQRRLLGFFLTAIVLAYFAASAVPFQWLEALVPRVINGIRNPALIASLATPPILALSAWAVDLLLRLEWPRLDLRLVNGTATRFALNFSTMWLVLPLPLLLALRSAYQVNRVWLETGQSAPGVQWVTDSINALLPSDQTQWVQTPWGEHFWLPPAMDAGHKIAHFLRPWWWRQAELPPPFVEAVRDPSFEADPAYHATVDGILLLVRTENRYAVVDTGTAVIPCAATALGGDIDVTCTTTEAGWLVVREHWWMGWRATRDGQRLELAPGAWLSAEAPAGTHLYRFRYRPWDVLLGLLLTLTGLGLAVYWWRRPIAAPELPLDPEAANPQPA
jgi:hypothetical protein